MERKYLLYPIDPFQLMRKYGIVYQFMRFEDLGGIFFVPKDENNIQIVGINYMKKYYKANCFKRYGFVNKAVIKYIK